MKTRPAFHIPPYAVFQPGRRPLRYHNPRSKTIIIDPDNYEVRAGSRCLEPPLSNRQWDLLHLFWINRQRVVSRNEIADTVYTDAIGGDGVSEQAIDALVRRLRDRLATLTEAEVVHTVRGRGFKFVG